jgi:hypothetical protein
MKSTSPAGPISQQAELVRQLSGLFDTAAGESERDDAFIDLAGQTVSMGFAGAAMSDRIRPALSHLEVDPDPGAALTISIWDSTSTSTPPPVAPWGPDDFRERGIIRGFYGDGFYTLYDLFAQSLIVVDAANGQAFFWMRDGDAMPSHERSAPLRTLFNLWLSGGDTQLVHGGAVGTPEGCILLVGPSGAGKSSTALSCLGSGLGLIGEDYCLVSRGDPPLVSSIYSTGKLAPGALSRLPHLASLRTAMPEMNDAEGKALIDLASSAPGDLLRSAPLAGIAVPRIVAGREETTSSPCSAGAALAAAAPSTMLQMPGNGEPAWRWLTELVRSVPCHELQVGSDPAGIPPAIEGILEA